ncbi:MAG: hypothetical protein GEU80_04465 [Dehalococcoidia bacterium]|nr:hypothetical protein [Dehalococcoidia bacterium]
MRPRLPSSWLPAAAITFLALLAACDSGETSTPTAGPTSLATATPTATTFAPPGIESLDLREGCHLFDEGHILPASAGAPVSVRLRPSACGADALADIEAVGGRLLVEWEVVGVEGVAAAQGAFDRSGSGEWVAEVTFPAPGTWRAPEALGIGRFIDVGWADYALAPPTDGLPLPATPQRVVLLDADAASSEMRWAAEQGGIGWLARPERVVFVQAREGGRWLVTGDVATDEVEPLFEVGPFAIIAPAPDGRAVAVGWGTPNGERELRVVTATGDVTQVDDSSLSHIALTWSPDSGTLLASGESLWVLEPNGAVRGELPITGPGAPIVTWAPDSSFALLTSFTQRSARLERLDPETATVDLVGEFAIQGLNDVAISPDVSQLAVAWREDDTLTVSVAALDGVGEPAVRAGVVQSFDETDLWSAGLTWSPDGRSVALTTTHFPVGSGGEARSTVRILDPASGVARTVATAADFYSTYRPLAWTEGGGPLLAVRFPCTACEPGTASVDAVDIATGGVIASFEDSGYLRATLDGRAHLLSTPAGIVVTGGRDPGTLVAPGAFALFAPAPVSPVSGRYALLEGSASGHRVMAARPDGSEMATLARFGLDQGVTAMVDADTVITRGDGEWVRRELASRASEAYTASSDAPEKTAFVLSPLKRLALDLDPAGFAVLDVDAPEAAPVHAHRAYPTSTAGLPAWSPDETRVAFGAESEVGVVDLQTGAASTFTLEDMGIEVEGLERLWALEWTADGAAIEFATASALWRLDPATGDARRVADAPRPGGFTQGTILERSPDGEVLVAATRFGAFALDEDGAWRMIARGGAPVASGSLAWSPDSSAVAYSAIEAPHDTPLGIFVAPVDGSGAYRLVLPGVGRVLGWLPDGRIAWTSTSGGV